MNSIKISKNKYQKTNNNQIDKFQKYRPYCADILSFIINIKLYGNLIIRNCDLFGIWNLIQ